MSLNLIALIWQSSLFPSPQLLTQPPSTPSSSDGQLFPWCDALATEAPWLGTRCYYYYWRIVLLLLEHSPSGTCATLCYWYWHMVLWVLVHSATAGATSWFYFATTEAPWIGTTANQPTQFPFHYRKSRSLTCREHIYKLDLILYVYYKRAGRPLGEASIFEKKFW